MSHLSKELRYELEEIHSSLLRNLKNWALKTPPPQSAFGGTTLIKKFHYFGYTVPRLFDSARFNWFRQAVINLRRHAKNSAMGLILRLLKKRLRKR